MKHHLLPQAAARFLNPVICIAAILVTLSCAHVGSESSDSVSLDTTHVEITKSPNDAKEYRYFTLSNGLRGVLVRHDGTDKSAASLVVARGSYDDPDEIPGLAHFLEHMLFIGTEKYPEVDSYQEFLSTHGGFSNAYTAPDHTNYYFAVDTAHFEEALDRLSQFFISPLFDEDYVEREKKAVHSEYQLQLKTDGWRSQAVFKVIANPEHPASRFTIGSSETLHAADARVVREFFEENYSADQMFLVTVTDADLDQQLELVEERFGDVPNRMIGDSPVLPPLYDPDAGIKGLAYKTIEDNKAMSLLFPIPTLQPHYRSKPTLLLGHLIGDEGKGSLHEFLNDKGWITSLSAGGGQTDNNNAGFSVGVGLTDLGSQHLPEIKAHIFNCIDLVREKGIEEWRYDEMAKLNEIDFQFREESTAMSVALSISSGLLYREPEDVLSGGYLMEGFDEDLTREYLSYLTPENSLTFLSGPDIETDSTEKWFSVPYRLSPEVPIADEVESHFTLPMPNEYVPSDLALRESAGDSGVHEIDSASSPTTIWHALDTEFGVPRAQIQLQVAFQNRIDGPRDIVLSSMYRRLLTEELNSYSYPASLAGVSYGVSGYHSGLVFGFGGYNDKLQILMRDVIRTSVEMDFNEQRFQKHAEEYRKSLQDFKKRRPMNQATNVLSNLIVPGSWPPDAALVELESITLDELSAWRDQQLETVHTRLFALGNVSSAEAVELAGIVDTFYNNDGSEPPKPTINRMSNSLLKELTIDHDDAVFIQYFQGSDATVAERAHIFLLAQILSSPFFTELRTNQQLGYAVFCSPYTYQDHPGLYFLVQSPTASPKHISESIAAFVAKQRDRLSTMTNDELEDAKAGLLSDILQHDRNLSDRYTRYLANIDYGVFTFDRRQQQADAVRAVTRDSLSAKFAELVDPTANNQVVVFARGKFEDGYDKGLDVGSITEFKNLPN